jgi:hypothetical protein
VAAISKGGRNLGFRLASTTMDKAMTKPHLLDVSYTSEVTRLAAVLLAPSINFPLSKQPTDQMVRNAVDTAIKLYATAWERCERGGKL